VSFAIRLFCFVDRVLSVCFDCGSLDPDWASVSHGTLVCLKCAGRHRTLGVHVSRIKSLTMDAWEPQHVAAMLLSGNKQVKDFFTKSNIQNSPIEDLYRHTRAAEFYRKKLQEQVCVSTCFFFN
jgi:ADP-ribosylation factor GTPase-activating protein 1